MKFIRFAILVLMPLLGWSCSDRADEPGAATESPAGSYLRLTLAVTPDRPSRANPAAGEDGDGREDGVNKENDIDNIAVFIYDDPGDGLDSDPATPIVSKGYADRSLMKEENGALVCTVRLTDYLPSNTHRAAVVANAGDIIGSISTLGELRTRPATDAWIPGNRIAETSGFVMASAYNGAKRPSDDDGRVRVLHLDAGNVSDPNFAASVSLERVAARIDLMYSSIATSGLFYRVNSALNSSLFVTHVLPVNMMLQPSYTLKHVSDGHDTSRLLVCGDETVGQGGEASNYTIAPTTLLKGDDTPTGLLQEWFGTSAASHIRQHPEAFDGAIAFSALLGQHLTLPEPVGAEKDYFILAYSNENTQLPDAHDSRFITGLALRAIYRPAKIFTDAACTASIDADVGGTSFWLLRPTSQAMGEDNCLYFASEEAALGHIALHPGLQATVEHYPGGICYYNLWIRHAGRLCGIVRNNIYRISLSFTGPGLPTPEITEYDNVESRIFVRRWNFRPQSEILM